jgi:ketosteroid isomerase-like protein
VTQDPEAMLREGLEAWNRGDSEAILSLLARDVRIRLSGAFAGLGPEYHGHQGYLKFWREFRNMWETLEVQPEEMEMIDGLLLAAVRFRGKGREGIEVDQVFYFVFEFNEDTTQVTAYRAFSDRAEATAVVREARAKGGLPV